MRHTLLIAALSFLVAAPAGAQQLKVSFDNGLVSVDATSVPVRQILNEWAKQGGTKVVGAERITGAPLTIKLIDVPEAQALEIILRSVAGYMAAPRALRHWRIDVRPHSRDGDLGGAAPPPPPRARHRRHGSRTGHRRHAAFRSAASAAPAGRRRRRKRTIRIRRIRRCSRSRSSRGMIQPGQFPNLPANSGGQPMIVNPATAGRTSRSTRRSPQLPDSRMPVGSPTPGMINAPPPQPGQPVRPPGRSQ